MNTQLTTEQNNSLSQISSHTHFILERDNWYDYFPNKNTCDRIFVELEKEEHKWILDFFLRDTSLKIEQKVRILQILTPHWYDLLTWFDTSKREELRQIHFTPETWKIALIELWLLDESERKEIATILQWNEYMMAGCIRKDTIMHQKTIANTYQKITQTLHPTQIKQATRETVRDLATVSKREAQETIKMFKIYTRRIIDKDSITEQDIIQAHQQAKDLARLMFLAPILVVPASAAILYLLDKIAKKMNIPLMPSQSFEDEKNKTDTDNFNS